MPARRLIELLPPEIKEELDRRIVAKAFSGYRELSEWLHEQGFEISRQSVHRYGQQFEERLSAIRMAAEQAKAISEAVGDDQNLMGDALISLCQQKLFDVLVTAAENPGSFDLSKVARAAADLNRSAVQQKKWLMSFKKRVDEKFEELAAAPDIDQTALDRIRQEVYGLF